ncbi:MAG: HhH-GPD-type base excision DNA repair protein [Haloechinothrix sp.]
MGLWLTHDDDANRLLDSDPFALVTAMLLDQQYPMEAAFAGPKKIADRMDGFDIGKIAAADPTEFEALCSTPPAIHRYGRSMARRVQELAKTIIAEYDGDAAAIWTRNDPDGAEVFRRLKALPGWGDQKCKIFVALLAKQRDVRPGGWQKAAGHYAEAGSRRSIADVTGPDSLQEVRAFKKAEKAAAKAAK